MGKEGSMGESHSGFVRLVQDAAEIKAIWR